MQLRTIARNIFSNWTAYAVTAAVGFFLSPLVVHRLGNSRYGLWTLILSVTGYFGLLDLGIRSSVGRFVARYVALGNDKDANRTINTAFVVLSVAGLLALLGAIVVVHFFFGRFHVEPKDEVAGKIALLILGFNISCILPLGVFTAVLIARERFDVISGVAIIGALIRAALVVICLKLDFGLISLAIITLLTGLGQSLTMAVFAKSLYSPLQLGTSLFSLAALRELLSFGVYRFIWILADQLIFYTDSVVIAFFLGAGSVTYYAIAGSLIEYSRNFVVIMADTFYPLATRLDAKQDLAGLRELQVFGTKLTLLVALPLGIGLILLGKQFIALWMGPRYLDSAAILVVLTIPQFTSMSQYVSALVLAGIAKHKILAQLALAEGCVNLILSIVLVQKMGLIGVAWGTVIPHLITSGLIIPLYTLRRINLGLREYLAKAFVRPLLCALPYAVVCLGFARLVHNVTWAVFAGELLVASSLFAVLSYFLCLNAGQRAALVNKLQALIQREAVLHDT